MSAVKPRTFFVTGTDTGVGKSLVSAALLCAAQHRGLSTAGLKPVAAGCDETPAGLRNEDALLLHKYTSLPLLYDQISPVSLRLAVAPHIAAEQEGKRLDVSRLEGICRAVMMLRADLTVIEGAGGWRVPLNPRHFLSDIALALNVPVILVVGIRLGCINHALLTAQAIHNDGVTLAGWVANVVDVEMPFIDENVAAIESRIGAPCLVRIPHQGNVEGRVHEVVENIAALFDMERLLRA